MDIYSLLKQDHREMENLLNHLISKPNPRHEDVKEVQTTFKDLMTNHLLMEEKFLYPRMCEVKEAEQLTKNGFEEHKKARTLAKGLEGERIESDSWVMQCQKLLQAVKAHVQEEEDKLFPIMQSKLKKEEVAHIYQEMLNFREKNLVIQ